MSVNRIADRYAKSLIDLAIEGNKLDDVLSDIQTFVKMLDSRELMMVLKSPIVNASKKSSIFKALFQGKFNELTMSFFDVILRKGREEFLPEIASNFVDQYKEFMGITDVALTTAVPVSADLVNELQAKLEQSNVTNKSVEITTKVDSSLIGGFVLEIGDKLYDNSISHKLQELKKNFATA